MSKDLIPVEDYMITDYDPQEVKDIVQDNIGGQDISEFDLDRITIPPGGATNWIVPTLEGEESQEAIEGVIVHWKNARAFWADSLEDSGGGTPPDCASDNAIIGKGEPGGLCDECPHAEFGSAANGRGQACKMVRLLFVVQPDSLLPVVVSLPPTSLAVARKHFLRLAGRGVHYSNVVHRLTLERTKNDQGIAYSKIKMQIAKQLPPEMAKKFRQYGEMLKPVFEAVDISEQDMGE